MRGAAFFSHSPPAPFPAGKGGAPGARPGPKRGSFAGSVSASPGKRGACPPDPHRIGGPAPRTPTALRGALFVPPAAASFPHYSRRRKGLRESAPSRGGGRGPLPLACCHGGAPVAASRPGSLFWGCSSCSVVLARLFPARVGAGRLAAFGLPVSVFPFRPVRLCCRLPGFPGGRRPAPLVCRSERRCFL